MNTSKQPTFEEALKRLQEINTTIASNGYTMDQLCTVVEEAAQLIAFCKTRLSSTNEEVKKILATLA